MTKISFIENQSENRVSNFRNMWKNKLGPALVWSSDLISTFLQILACVVLTVAILVVAIIFFIGMNNVIMFPIWAHLFPKGIAHLFYERPMDEKQPNNMVDAWATICVAFISWAHRRLHGWMPRHFAWYAKKWFILEEPTAFSKKDVVRYIRSLESDGGKTAFFHNLLITKEGYDEMNAKKTALLSEIWAMNDMWLNKPYLEAKEERNEKYTVEEVKYICESANYTLLDKYMKRATLSEDMLKVMLPCSRNDGAIQSRVNAHIIKHGVSAEFVVWATTQGEAFAELVDSDLTIYSQIVMTKQHQCTTDEKVAESWKKFCEATPTIYPEAQKEFCLRQLVIFYETGHELSEEAVFHFFYLATKEKNDVADVIFHHEGAKALKSDRIKTLVKSNYWLNCHALELA